jgi:hypothetical protein
MTTASAAVSASAASPRELYSPSQGAELFLVEEMERRQTYVGDFLFTEEKLKWYGFLRRRNISLRDIRHRPTRRRCPRSSGDSHYGYCFAWTLPFRSTVRL